MVDLLGTYTTENASEAKEEAQRCIIASLADPSTFLFDHFLSLSAPMVEWSMPVGRGQCTAAVTLAACIVLGRSG